MKKIISVIMCLALTVCVFAGCVKQEDLKSDIVLITNGGTITDGGYNQSAWEGITAYADENAMTYSYYQPMLEDEKLTSENVEKYVSLASKNGAEYVVFPGEEFAVCAYDIAPAYPDINFILIDAMPHSEGDNTDSYLKNVMSVSFDAIQAGYLAGYITVMNGNTQLGYFGEFDSDDSANYGAGFVQGAAYAADSLGIPVTVDWADYDSPLLDYNYDFNIVACYEKVEDQSDTTYNVKVEGGLGSGTYTDGSNVTITANPAEEGKVFDHWEVKSDTEGVKDSKVNISSETKSSMNLLVEKCDCTITAVYKDIEGEYNTVKVMNADGETVYSTFSVEQDGECEITAPVAANGMVFDHWETDAVKYEMDDATAQKTVLKSFGEDITLTPVYVQSDKPTFNVTVTTGEGGDGDSTGSGSYVAGDVVDIKAAVPKEGYMFSHWENTDSYGYSTGISMANEYYWNTTFEMVDRYAAVCEKMFDEGVTSVFTGGNSKSDSAFTAKWNYDYNLNVVTAGAPNGDAYTTIVKNYGEAVKDCLEAYSGGSVFMADCSNDCIYASFVSEDKDIQAKYDEVYKSLADNKVSLVKAQGGAGYDFCKYFNENDMSKCLTLNGMFLEGITLS